MMVSPVEPDREIRDQLAAKPDDVHLDHIIPYSRGGPTTVENLRVTHSACNLRKGAAWPESA